MTKDTQLARDKIVVTLVSWMLKSYFPGEAVWKEVESIVLAYP